VIDRRAFTCLLAAGVFVAPLAVRAQTPTKMRRVGVLTPSEPSPTPLGYEAPLRDLGWIEGKNLVVERRFTNFKYELLPGAAEELVRLKPELIITAGTEATLAAKNATTSIPIVMASAADPVGSGIVASLARPGGNITGYSIIGTELAAERAARVHELLPRAQRVALIAERTRPVVQLLRRETEVAYRSLGVTPVAIEGTGGMKEFQEALDQAGRLGVQAVDLMGWEAPVEDASAIIATTMRYRLPVIISGGGEGRALLEAGGLMSLTNDYDDQGRRVAVMIDKILRGTKPADIPIEQPTRFRLSINLKAAKALGIEVPQSLLLRADEVIR
jgi:putative ABC transport system substrate-binding protein